MVGDPNRRALYHQKIHRSLARPPIAIWEELAVHPDVSFRDPENKEHFFYDFLPYVERKIGRDGINLFGIKYWDSVLSVWAGVSSETFIVRYDPRNLAAVFVQSPGGDYLAVRYRELSHPVITLWEHKLARKALREQGRREFNERTLFDAIEAQRMLTEESAWKTKSARRLRQRTAEAVLPEKPRQDFKTIEMQTAKEEGSLPILPFEIEDWS